jgi:hypothetical protein
MNRNVPYQKSFDNTRKLSFCQNIVLVIITICSIVQIFLNVYDISCGENALTVISSFFIVIYLVLEVLVNDFFYNSGKKKRLDLIDHAFETHFTGEKSSGYFNSGNTPKGVYKLAVQSFENSLFTSEISKRMLLKSWGITSIIFIVFIFSAFIGSQLLVNSLVQFAATGILIQQSIKLQLFSNRMNLVLNDFKQLFSDMRNLDDKSSKEGEMVKNILNYETTHSWGSILADSKIFNQLNPSLSATWEDMKRSYNI